MTQSSSLNEMFGQGAAAIAKRVAEYQDVLLGLEGLRAMGRIAESAIEETLRLPDIRRLRLSWVLYSALVAGEGLDAEACLLDELSYGSVDIARTALLGGAISHADNARLPDRT